MPWETPDEEIDRLEDERRRYELMLAGTPESQKDRRAHLQEWVDRRTAELDKLHDRRPLGPWDKFALGTGAVLCTAGAMAVDPIWPSIVLYGLALLILDSFRTGALVHLARRAARRLTYRARRQKPRRGLL